MEPLQDYIPPAVTRRMIERPAICKSREEEEEEAQNARERGKRIRRLQGSKLPVFVMGPKGRTNGGKSLKYLLTASPARLR